MILKQWDADIFAYNIIPEREKKSTYAEPIILFS